METTSKRKNGHIKWKQEDGPGGGIIKDIESNTKTNKEQTKAEKIATLMNALSEDGVVTLLERIAKNPCTKDRATTESEPFKKLTALGLITEGTTITITKKGKKVLEFIEKVEKTMKSTGGRSNEG